MISLACEPDSRVIGVLQEMVELCRKDHFARNGGTQSKFFFSLSPSLSLSRFILTRDSFLRCFGSRTTCLPRSSRTACSSICPIGSPTELPKISHDPTARSLASALTYLPVSRDQKDGTTSSSLRLDWKNSYVLSIGLITRLSLD